MVPQDILAHVLSMLLVLGLLPIGHVLGASSPVARAPGKRSPAVHFPLNTRDIGTIGENGRRIITIEEAAEVRRRDLQTLQSRQGINQELQKRSGWETVGLSSFARGAFYYISMQIGTPPQTIDVGVGTASADLRVLSSTCLTCQSETVLPVLDSSQVIFNYSSSSSFHASSPQENVQQPYLNGTVIQGIVATEKVSVGQYTANNQTFILTVAGNATVYPVGWMGFAWPSLAQSGGTPWWLNVLDQFEEPEFSFFLAEGSYSDPSIIEPGGQFTLGGRNHSLYDGTPSFIPIISQSNWTIPFSTIIVDNQTTLNLPGNSASATIDSGTTLIYGPDDVVTALYAAIPGAVRSETVNPTFVGQWLVPCTTIVNPQFKFTDNATFTLPATNFLWAELSPSSSPGSSNSSQYCIGSIMGASTLSSFSTSASTSSANPTSTSVPNPSDPPTIPNWILGGVFMKSVYTVFRKGETGEQPSVGFAPIKGVNYSTNALPIIGVGGDGIDGRIGEAGVTIMGTAQPPESSSIAPGSTGGAIRMGLDNYPIIIVAFVTMWGLNW